ncbi:MULTISPECIES: S8 family serine peptidase [unclassified Clostridium]|uniref:S8 family serine peptidase n=1 Tax=unclassified Clostridium TaxID=2614128 RepID=UPI0025D03C95|nr:MULTISPECIES: S8 family serine peptidase [unclassified Clostridium]
MVNIEGNLNNLGILKNMPTSILSKLNISHSFLATNNDSEIEVSIISGASPSEISKIVENLNGKYVDLGYGYGIAEIPIENLVALATSPEIQYIELPKSLYADDYESNRASCITQLNSSEFNGKGVLIGFIDTGIDYTHPAFRNPDGTTRIEYIYDLDEGGKVYTKEQINEALKSSDPYSIVNSTDITGHGTHVVGIACAGGKIDKQYYGVAPESSIAMVKVARSRFALSTQIMKGIKFLIDKGKELNMPLAINMSLSTNDGAHNGSSLLEQYISTVSATERVTIVIAAGNEGEAAHHVGGTLEEVNDVYFNISSDESIVVINLYKSILPQLSIELISPYGIGTGEILVKEGVNEGTIGNSRYSIYLTGPKPFDVSGEIGIILTGINGFVSSGQWKITLRKLNKYDGNFDMWLPISEGLNVNTKFLEPVVYNTLGIPATVKNVISVGSYNYLVDIISPFSGRGEKYNGQYIKPDIVAPGEGIYSSIPNRAFDKKTGTSMATPQVTGAAALMMQWGIVNGNDPYLYGERVKYFLILGSKKTRQDIEYPDAGWGYGELCLRESINLVSQTLGLGLRNKESKVILMDDYLKRADEINVDYNSDSKDKIFLLAEVSNQEVLKNLLKIQDIEGVMISSNFAVIITPADKVDEVKKLAIRIVNIEVSTILTLNDISPVEASGAPVFNTNPYLRLNGRDVLVGVIDTGIDYLNKEFQMEDDTTRIVRLWDQTIQGDKYIYGLKYGVEYTEDQINQAISLQTSGGDPYSIVPSKDEIGHGTKVSGIIGGRGINPDLKGVAPDCKFVIVKLSRTTKVELDAALIDKMDVPSYSPWSVLLGIRYVVSVARELNKPLVLFIPMGSNMGSHTGNGIDESIIDNYSTQAETVIVVPVGNQGNTDTHTEGIIEKAGDIKDIEIRIGERQKNLPITIWINKPNRVKLSIISPTGEIIDNIEAKNTNNRRIKFLYEKTEMIVNFTSPELSTGDTLIFIRAYNLRPGIWKFRLTGEYIVEGNYYAWIPQRELIDDETKFLNPVEYTTITLPSTSNNAISVGYYNQNNNSIVSESSNGYTRYGNIKPDIVAGGSNALVTIPGGATSVMSGSSVAGAVVAGCCALILQWAVTDGNYPGIYSSQIKTYIISGAKTRPGDIYPNRQWGYGMFDLQGVFDWIKQTYTPRINTDFEEYRVKNLFIRKPRDL